MKGELKRAIFKKSNLIIIFYVIGMMFINAYYGGWSTALSVGGATDIANIADKLFFQKYFGNVYRVWGNSYYMIQALAPLLLVTPYLTTYLDEKSNNFRFFVVSRKSTIKYNVHKALTIAVSGTVVLATGEALFYFLSYFLTQHDVSIEFLQEIVYMNEHFFYKNPMLYFLLIYGSHIVYYFCFLFLAIGVTSFLKNKIAIIITPFVFVGILDMLLPTMFQPNVVMQPYHATFSIIGYGSIIGVYVLIGIVLLAISEKRYLQRGT